MKFRILVFIILLSLLSTCLSDNFWMKLGWSSKTNDIIYCENGVFFISAYDSLSDKFKIYRSRDDCQNFFEFDVGERWAYVRYMEDNKYLYYRTSSELYKYDLEIDSINLVTKTESSFDNINFVEKFDDFYILSNWGQIIKYNQDWNDSTIVFQEQNSESINNIVKDSSGVYLASIYDPFNYLSTGVIRSFDNGNTWTDNKLDSHFVGCLTIDSENRIFAGTLGHYTLGGGRIFRSLDSGENWEQVTDFNNRIYTRCLAIDANDNIFAGLSDDWGFLGLYYSEDHGNSWAFLNEGLGGPTYLGGAGGINDILITPDGYVYLATDGGVYRSINPTTGIEEQNNITSDFILYQNYPNPFNNSTQISYTLKESSNVNISIFNANGEFVKRLVNAKQSKGNHTVSFSSDGLNSGIYFYQLEINGKVLDTKKMLYLR